MSDPKSVKAACEKSFRALAPRRQLPIETLTPFLRLTGEPTAAAVLVLAEAHHAAALNECLSVEQAAERRGVHVSTIRKLIKAGILPHQRIGRVIRIKAADLDRPAAPKRAYRCLKLTG